MTTKKSTPKQQKSNKKVDCFPSEWFDALTTPIFILDKSCQIMYANRAFCDLIKKRKKECFKVKPMDMVIEQKENRKFLKDILKVYGGKKINRGIYNLNVGNKTFKALLDISPVYDKGKKMVNYAIGVVLDHDAKKGLKRLWNIFK